MCPGAMCPGAMCRFARSVAGAVRSRWYHGQYRWQYHTGVDDMNRKLMTLQEARRWCIAAHGDQMYERREWGGQNRNRPYRYHLVGVEKVAIRFGFGGNIALRRACLAHDLLEDTRFTAVDMLDAGFTPYEVAIVDALTDGEGKTRKQKKQRVYRLIPLVKGAVLVKGFDRIFNWEYSIKSGNEYSMRTYIREYPEFKRRLFDANDQVAAPVWEHLDRLYSLSKAQLRKRQAFARRERQRLRCARST
jgi:hypothetical protein